MAFTPLLCTTDEIALFTKDVTPPDFKLTAGDFSLLRGIIHEAAQAQILQHINRISLTAAQLAAVPTMAAVLKQANIMLVSNVFIFWKQQKAGKVIEIGDLMVKLLSPEVFSKDIKEMIQPFRIYKFGTVDPDETITIT